MIRKKITDKNYINFSAAGKVTESVKSVGNNKGFFLLRFLELRIT